MPRPRDVLREQVRAVWAALRLPAVAVAAVAALGTLFVMLDILSTGVAIDFRPEYQMLPSALGLLFPIGVWRGVKRFGADFLWTLPVDRRRHVLARVFAGWTWLMAAVAVFLLWLLAMTLVSGGRVLVDETLLVLPDPGWGADPIDPAVLKRVPWPTQPLLWLVPFTAATGTYLLASTLALGTRHPLRWIVGVVLALLLLGVIGDLTRTKWLHAAPERAAELVLGGRYGMDALLTARTESLKIDVPLTTGERVVVWRGVPDLGEWALATLLWTGAGLIVLWAAASRHRERRRA
ncbi:MAG TPA: hypothetical protein VGR37_03190 [Longimicrobiaceae bacterium]|nr:hypothetical protein [Longimicrobiaceae bacterium]